MKCLIKLPVGKIVREHRPEVDAWPGLMIDVTEEQILSEITLANELSRTFAEHNVRLAIDDFGKGCATLMKLKELPFAEMKLDRSFVVGCGTDKVHAPICKTVINLAHSFGALAVGIGLEKPPTRWRSSAWAAISAKGSCSASRCRRSGSSRCSSSASPCVRRDDAAAPAKAALQTA